MRTLSLILLALVALVVVALSVGNRHLVPVFATPDFTAYGFAPPLSAEVPLFLVALLAAAVGYTIGVAQEYRRERKYRRIMRARRREIGRLEHELKSVKRDRGYDEDDEIIALTSR